VTATQDLQADADTDYPSVMRLLTALVQTPSRGGIDDYTAVIGIVETWLRDSGLEPQVLTGPTGPVAVLCDVHGTRPGPHYVLDACLDTADLGDESAWAHPPFSATVEDGWLCGRGTSDSKAAVAIFCHLAARLAAAPDAFQGTLTILFDLDEHTGGFAGIRSYLETPASADVAGVMIGYPGLESIVIGGRGFLRARATVFGTADHSASRRAEVCNAVAKAARLVDLLGEVVPTELDPDFGLPPKLTVTSIRGGTSGVYSVVPDRCDLEVDVRLTNAFDIDTAWKLLAAAVADIDAAHPAPRGSQLERTVQAWPPFRLPSDHPLPAALAAGARAVGLDPSPVVAGPSNIGNLLASRGIPATAGFGVRYRNLHATDEAIEIATIPATQAAYHHTVLTLLNDAIT
jgi:succinyl-diaminopimelate desuccinylase